MNKTFGLLLALTLTVFALPTQASAKHAKVAGKIRVHVVKANGKAAGHAHVHVKRPGHAKPSIAHVAGTHGNFTTGAVPLGHYTIRATLKGHGAGHGSVEVAGTGMHRVTVTLGKARTVAAAAHGRVSHSLGTASTAAKLARVRKSTPEANPSSKKKPAAKKPAPGVQAQ